MLQLVSYVGDDGLQIKAFREHGKPCYEGISPSGHIWWDICDCVDCQEEEGFEEDYSRRKKKSSQQKLKERFFMCVCVTKDLSGLKHQLQA